MRHLRSREFWKELQASGRSGVLLIPNITVGCGVRALFSSDDDGWSTLHLLGNIAVGSERTGAKTWRVISHVTKSQQARDAKANDESRGIMNAAAVAVWKDWAAKARKFRSHLLWWTGVRRRVAATESDNKADMVLSQGGTSITSVVRYQHKSHDYGRRYSSAIGVQRCCDRSCYQ